MGAITLEKANHLFWLGRYAERMTGVIRLFMDTYDKMIDVDPKAYVEFCNNLSIPYDVYKDDIDFSYRFIYDENLPDSLISTIKRAYDNAIVLREEISGDTYAYIDLAKRILEKENPGTLMLELQNVLDYINAFWGSANDTVDENSRVILKCGKHAEKLDIQYRFKIDDKNLQREMSKLRHRIDSLCKKFSIPGLEDVKGLFDNDKASPEEYIEYIFKLTDCFNVI